MLNRVGHRGTYRAGGGTGNRTPSAWRGGLAGCILLAVGCGGAAGTGATGSAGSITVTRAVAWGAADVKAVSVGMEINNQGDDTDTLVAVTSTAGAAMLHTEVPGQGMRPIPALPLQRHSAVRIGRGLHVMVEGLQSSPAPGTKIPVTLRFARAGPMELSVPVMRYSEALTSLGE